MFLVFITFAGCDSLFEYPDDNETDSTYDTGGNDDEPDYPDPTDYISYTNPGDTASTDALVDHVPDNSGPRDSIGFHIIWIGYWKIALTQSGISDENNSMSKTAANELKYYEIEESFSPDFSKSNKYYKLHKDYFRPYTTSPLVKYDRVRAVYTNSKSEWSNVVELSQN
jgi:hypothetical protein